MCSAALLAKQYQQVMNNATWLGTLKKVFTKAKILPQNELNNALPLQDFWSFFSVIQTLTLT